MPDHGEELYDHQNFGHRRTLHSEVLDVPLLIRLPRGRAGGLRVDTPVSLIDVPATILDEVGLLDALPGRRFGDGRSLLAEPGSDAKARPLLAEIEGPPGLGGALVQRWPHRLARMNLDRSGEGTVLELYDVSGDPREERDLAGSRPTLLGALDALLDEELARIEAQAPESEMVEPDEATRRRLQALGYAQ